MSLSKFESEVKIIPQTQETVYARFSDLNNLAKLKERLNDPIVQQTMSEQIPEEKLNDIRNYADSLAFDADSMRVSSPVGEITLRVVEREEPKCIKFASEGAPLQLYLWVQLLPYGEYECKMRVTVGAEVNFFMKGMVAKPLQQAADGIATMLANVGQA